MAEVKEAYRPRVLAEMGNTVTATALGVGERVQGKVRDMYILPDKVVLVTTDRISAFNRNLASIPFKGQVLNQCSVWWFEQTKGIIPNHILLVPDPTAIVCRKCDMFQIEFVVRGFMTGSTDTSIWRNYSQGVRSFCGHQLPEGLKKNDRLAANIVTPTTKEKSDRNISPADILSEGWMTKEDFEYCSQKALEIFALGQKKALERGFLLVDTKYEFGRLADGTIVLADEIHTPDSSRYWLAASYEERHAKGEAPQNIDKDILRRWYLERCDPYKDEVMPDAPDDLRATLSLRYIQLYEMITGLDFEFPSEEPAQDRLAAAVKSALSS